MTRCTSVGSTSISVVISFLFYSNATLFALLERSKFFSVVFKFMFNFSRLEKFLSGFGNEPQTSRHSMSVTAFSFTLGADSLSFIENLFYESISLSWRFTERSNFG